MEYWSFIFAAEQFSRRSPRSEQVPDFFFTGLLICLTDLDIWQASPGHVSTQGKAALPNCRSQHKSHFCMIPFSVNWGTPKSQASAQMPQPLQRVSSTTTKPSFSRLEMASSGQPAAQAGSTLCRQANEREAFFTRGYSPCHKFRTRRYWTP